MYMTLKLPGKSARKINCYGMVIASAELSRSMRYLTWISAQDSILEETLRAVYIGAPILDERDL